MLAPVLNLLIGPQPDLLGFLFVAIIFLIALALHEFGHAAAATALGDDTAKEQGRLTLNPIKHLDPVGTVFIVLVGFGWGKPVPFNPYRLRSKRFGSALVGGAGPLVNLLLALLSAAAIVHLAPAEGSIRGFLRLSLHLNVLLAMFNLIPIPPLDGSRILSALLPPQNQRVVFWLDRWGFVLLILVVWILPRIGPWQSLLAGVQSSLLRIVGGGPYI